MQIMMPTGYASMSPRAMKATLGKYVREKERDGGGLTLLTHYTLLSYVTW